MRRLAASTALLVLASIIVSTLGAAPAAAAPPEAAPVVTLELRGDAATRFVVDDRRYAGPMVFTRLADGITVSERASIEQYLEGIAEMPFSWEAEALAAQAVAARTYLARTLLGGRRGDAAVHAYDICATSRCQVYRGTQYVDGDGGERWRRAVTTTRDELVLYRDRPIEAVYTSMVGTRSRANQDVWPSDPVPYLQPVDSPERGRAPFAEWTIEVTSAQFVEILRADGLDVGGALVGIAVDDPPEGSGRTSLTIVTEEGTDSILAPAMKGSFNRHGDVLYPGALPASTAEGRRLPEPLPSYTYDIEHLAAPTRSIDRFLADGDRQGADVVRIVGEGWGHGVGMSQWGAQIMATEGATHEEILAHYYTGTTVTVAPDLVPDSVVVGLETGAAGVIVDVEGTATLLVNGIPFTSVAAGTWEVRAVSGTLAIVPGDGVAPLAPFDTRPWPR